MNPDQNQYSIDYLNEISPQQKKPGMSNKLFFIVIGGGLLVAAIVGILLLTSTGSAGPTEKMGTLASRLITLKTISTSAQRNIKSGDLRSTNSNLDLFLTNANRDIVEPLSTNGVTISKIDKKIVAEEKNEDLVETLENARLNAVFDRTYSREMAFQLDTVATLMKDIYTSTNSKSLKEFLEATDKNLQPIKKQLVEFNAANG